MYLSCVCLLSSLRFVMLQRNGMYVSIVGSLKGFYDRKRATAFAIRWVISSVFFKKFFDEINFDAPLNYVWCMFCT